MTLGKIGARKMMGKPSGGWQPPSDWPDIREILEADVTPQAAIDAGATKKWIMLCNPGPPGGGYAQYGFAPNYHVYLRMSDGVTSTDIARPSSGNTIVTPLDDGRMFWVIVYTSGDSFYPPQANTSYTVGPVWFHAPEHIPDFSYNSRMFNGYVCLRKATFREWPSDGCTSMFANMLESVDTIAPSILYLSGGGIFYRHFALREVPPMRLLPAATQLNTMFDTNGSLQSVDVSAWDTSAVTKMESVFRDCIFLQNIDVSSWDTSNVDTFYNMFTNCANLVSIDVHSWNTAKVTRMDAMFSGCLRLKGIDISGWDFALAKNIDGMFANCQFLSTIIGGKTYAQTSPDPMKGPRENFRVSYSPLLDYDSLLFLVHWVADLNSLGLPGKTLTLGNTNKAKLSDAEKAIAQNKGWTLA